MTKATRQHPNAPHTPAGRQRMVDCVIKQGWSVEAAAERFQVDAKTVRKWVRGSGRKASAGSKTAPVVRAPVPGPPHPPSAKRCSSCVASVAGVPTILPTS